METEINEIKNKLYEIMIAVKEVREFMENNPPVRKARPINKSHRDLMDQLTQPKKISSGIDDILRPTPPDQEHEKLMEQITQPPANGHKKIMDLMRE